MQSNDSTKGYYVDRVERVRKNIPQSFIDKVRQDLKDAAFVRKRTAKQKKQNAENLKSGK